MNYPLTEAQIRLDLKEANVPEHTHDGMVLYLTEGILPGHFLTAVLENDLAEACSRADDTNRYRLYDYVYFLYNFAPSRAWGSVAFVEAWVEQHAKRRAERADTLGGVPRQDELDR